MKYCDDKIKTPYYVVDEALLEENLKILDDVQKSAGCKILLAQKAFSMFSGYPLIAKYLSGSAASGLFEAKLGKECMGGETHVFSAAYRPDEIDEIFSVCDHIVFNSFNEWKRYRTAAKKSGKKCGLRINPEKSTQKHGIYDPCAEGSRLGIKLSEFEENELEGISGIHFHTLCEQNSDALIATLAEVEKKFGRIIDRMDWVNFGGGHHITRDDYDRAALISAIKSFKERHKVEVYLEPGEAVALDCGFLVSTVLDITGNKVQNAILDTSAACHMPDVIEMPYRPNIIGSGEPNERKFSYRLGGPTCLAGDIIGEYSFNEPLKIGDRLVFCDMAIYSMVKNNTFNGMNLPSIVIADKSGGLHIQKSFGYEDFKSRLS